MPPGAKSAGQSIQNGEAVPQAAPSTTGKRRPAGLKPSTVVCCLTGREEWTAPEIGQPCRSRRHGHMDLAHADSVVAQERAEWVRGEREVLRKGVWMKEDVWIPVIRFLKARTWRKTMSRDADGKGPAATMQLVS